MNYIERLQNVSILGAAGKMGSGILLLTAVEVADLSLLPENKDRQFVLNAIDVSPLGLKGLMKYMKTQVLKIAEKKIVWLREIYASRTDLVENGEIIEEYVFDVLSLVHPTVRIEAAFESTLIFEAIKEDPAVKVSIFSKIDKNNPNKPWYFTNTSSIPIGKLNIEAALEDRIIGFHFYNPPAVQKLVELIKTQDTSVELEDFALQFAKKLRKVVVHSNDFAGFIGNGHFMRDALHGIAEVELLTSEMHFTEAVYMINKVSHDYLIRPMGIFQLIDYVGIDVCQYILSVMAPYFPNETLHSKLFDDLLQLEVKGGQNADGSQKDGFFKYEKGLPVAVFDFKDKSYKLISTIKEKCDNELGPMPISLTPWKLLIKDRNKTAALIKYFEELKSMESLGARLAKAYYFRSLEIGLQLVRDGVANSKDDVNSVMLTGFFHAYGPINDFITD
jgi:3-hydroxyacyl-CoA dehydrogenase